MNSMNIEGGGRSHLDGTSLRNVELDPLSQQQIECSKSSSRWLIYIGILPNTKILEETLASKDICSHAPQAGSADSYELTLKTTQCTHANMSDGLLTNSIGMYMQLCQL